MHRPPLHDLVASIQILHRARVELQAYMPVRHDDEVDAERAVELRTSAWRYVGSASKGKGRWEWVSARKEWRM